MNVLYNSLSSITTILSSVIQNLRTGLDYNNSKNKPSINNVQLTGNLTSQDLGLLTAQNFFDIVNLADIQFDPRQVYQISANTQMRNISNQPAVFVYNDKGMDVTSLATIQWKDQVLTVNATGLSSFNMPLTGTWKIKFAGPTIHSGPINIVSGDIDSSISSDINIISGNVDIISSNLQNCAVLSSSNIFTNDQTVNANLLVKYNESLVTISSLVSRIQLLQNQLQQLSSTQVRKYQDYYIQISDAINPSGINLRYELDNITSINTNRIWLAENGYRIIHTQENGWEIQNELSATIISCNNGIKPITSQNNPYDETWYDLSSNLIEFNIQPEIII